MAALRESERLELVMGYRKRHGKEAVRYALARLSLAATDADREGDATLMCQIDNGHSCDVWRETWRRAAKSHRCSCCAARIEAGERYLQHFSVYDGEASSARLCAACDMVRRAFVLEHETTPHPTALWEMLRDCESEEAPDDDDDGVARPGRWAPMLEAIRARYEAAPQTLSGDGS